MKNYALIGAAGYIAPRHLKAIKETGGNLEVAYDPNDSVGIMDSHFPDASFFTEFERFESFVFENRSKGKPLDYVTVCSPNYLHKSHVAFGLRAGADVICEKPLALDPQDLDQLLEIEKETGQRVMTILQLRLHPAILALKNKVDAAPKDKIWDVDLCYFTSRGAWYHASWKGQGQKSGGIATNIGVHFFDMLAFVFGKLTKSVVQHRGDDAAAGYLEFEKAKVRWVLSINRAHLPSRTPNGQSTYRAVTIDGEEVEFSGGFTDLHTASYHDVLSNNGFGIEVVRPSINLVSDIRVAPVQPDEGDQHPDFKKVAG